MRYRIVRIAALLLGLSMAGATTRALPNATAAAAGTELLAAIPRSERIVLHATGPVKHRIVVFTDIECPYCRKFHRQVERYLQAGIEVQYLFYPRAGRNSPAFAKAVAVWCSRDHGAALTRAFDGRSLPARTCANPVAKHYELALRTRLLGTPALITEDGHVMYGAVPVSRLLERVEGPSRIQPPENPSAAAQKRKVTPIDAMSTW